MAVVDDPALRLATRHLPMLCAALGVTCALYNWSGRGLSCTRPSGAPISESGVAQWCWAQGLRVHRPRDPESPYYDRPHPGVGPEEEEEAPDPTFTYKMMPFKFLEVTLLLLLPGWLWRAMEGNKVASIAWSLHAASTEAERRSTASTLASYLRQSSHRLYTVSYVASYVLVLVIAAYEAISISQMATEDLFPSMGKCVIHLFGSSGALQVHDVLCMAEINATYLKLLNLVYYCSIVTIIVMVLSLLQMIIFLFLSNASLMSGAFGIVDRGRIMILQKKCSFDTFFLLSKIEKNVNKVFFALILNEMSGLEEKDQPVGL